MNQKDIDYVQLYEAAIFAIKANSGIGFHNKDQGHPVYGLGKEGSVDKHGPSPEQHGLFTSLRAMSPTCSTPGSSTTPPIETWEDYCKLAYGAYLKDHERERRGLPRMSELEA